MTRLLPALTVLVLCSAALAEDKKEPKFDAKLLIGKWEPKELKKEDGEPTGLEFTKDGKALLTHKVKGQAYTNEARYKLDGDKLSLTLDLAGKEVTVTATVTELTATELTAKDEKGVEKTLVRVKDKK